MITVHHLDNSRSQRILWLLEELELEYQIVFHKRQPIGLAPPELKGVHPLGKAPVVDLDGQVVAESGAALELITQRYGGGRLMPDPASAEYVRYVELLHYPEGSAAGPLGMLLFGRIFRVDNAGYNGYVASQVELHLDYIDGLLAGRELLIGEQLTAADIQLTFTLQQARRSKVLEQRPALLAYVARMEARDAYKRAIEKGGPFTLDIRGKG
jgi:glutathione S-transferase